MIREIIVMSNKYIIVFKNITEGFMDLKHINYLADVFQKKKLKEELIFILDNDANSSKNQAIMQMYNSLIGFDVFKAAFMGKKMLEYKHLNGLQLKKEIPCQEIDFHTYINERYNSDKIMLYTIESDLYKNLLSIIKEVL